MTQQFHSCVFTQEMRTCIHKRTFTETLQQLIQSRKHLETAWVSINRRTHKLINTKNNVWIYSTIWKSHTHEIMLSEKSQTPKTYILYDFIA